MTKPTHLPDTDRLSVLAAAILLAYAVTRFVNLPVRDLQFQAPGFFLELEVSTRTLITLLVAGLTATGADWVLREHPALRGKRTHEHWILPALTAWVIGVPLYQLPFGTEWLAGFLIGGALIMLVLLAEYISVDPGDVRYGLASAGLTAVSFGLFLILAISLRSAGVRLVFLLPALTLAAGLVCLRTLRLRLSGRWAFPQTLALALVIAQLTAALHYWPLAPIVFGLALLGPAYALTILISSLAEGEPLRQAVVEPAVVLAAIWASAILAL